MFGRKRRTDFSAEIQAHLEFEEDRLRAEGLDAEAAHAGARRALGNRTILQERFYNTGRVIWLDHLVRDLRLACRTLSRERRFAAFAIVLIGLGAGLTTAMYALFDGV